MRQAIDHCVESRLLTPMCIEMFYTTFDSHNSLQSHWSLRIFRKLYIIFDHFLIFKNLVNYKAFNVNVRA